MYWYWIDWASVRRCGRIGFALAGAMVAVCALAGCRDAPLADMTRLSDARQGASDALVQFIRSVDAGNRAVMADTDETSEAFATEAQTASNAVSRDVESLTQLFHDLDFVDESRLLQEFGTRFAEYTAVDREVLKLAVENTNLKAQRLSFGPAQASADAFRDALRALEPADAASTDFRVEASVAAAVAAVREVQVLQAPHIAESDEGAMTRLEQRAADAEAEARRSVRRLDGLLSPEARPKLQYAATALESFIDLNAQIVTLSRRNSNVRSLALSLGQKRTLAAACEDRLTALQDALGKRGFSGTR